MKAAKRQVDEINRLNASIEKTNSKYLKRDYEKNKRKLTTELQEYCGWKGYNFKKVMSGDFSQ